MVLAHACRGVSDVTDNIDVVEWDCAVVDTAEEVIVDDRFLVLDGVGDPPRDRSEDLTLAEDDSTGNDV